MYLVAWPHCFSHVHDAVLVLISRNLHEKSSEVSIKTRLTPASLSFKGQATKHTIVKLSVARLLNFAPQIVAVPYLTIP